MEVIEIIPTVRTFKIVDDADPSVQTIVTFDLDRYSLFIEYDGSRFAYTWKPAPDSESFLRLAARWDKEYLLSKIASRCIFNLCASKAETIDLIKTSKIKVSKDALSEISSINAESLSLFFSQCENILYEEKQKAGPDSFFISDYIVCVRDYPVNAFKSANIFCDTLQPHLRKLLKEEIEEN